VESRQARNTIQVALLCVRRKPLQRHVVDKPGPDFTGHDDTSLLQMINKKTLPQEDILMDYGFNAGEYYYG
jgi:hypothetical protein